MYTEVKMANSLRHQLVEQLGQEIETGQLPPGSRLDERSIGERFGISRTPAREVLLQLSAAGLVQFVPRRGAIVLSMSPQEIVSMVEVLVALEGEAASLAARRMEASEREDMARQYARGTEAIDTMSTEDYSAINTALHEAIYAGCRNAFLTAEIRRLRVRLAPYLRSSFVARGRLRSSHDEHQSILAAILACNEEAAELAMRMHLLNGGNLFADMFAKFSGQKSSD
jgi:DNA-binding GntR family transcriptional regulator